MTNERMKELFLLVMEHPTMENVKTILKESSELDISDKDNEDEAILNVLSLTSILLKHDPTKYLTLTVVEWLDFAKKFKSIIHDTDVVERRVYSLIDKKIAEFGYIQKDKELVKI
ncbi:hypothetical protein D3C87_573860 [compost metagenome]